MDPQTPRDQFPFTNARVARRWRKLLDERLKDLGVTQARWFTMICLQRGGGGLTQRELARLMTIENPTLVRLLDSLEEQGMEAILCAAVHGIFAEASDQYLLAAGLQSLVTTNTIPHSTNGIDVSELLAPPIRHFLNQDRSKSR